MQQVLIVPLVTMSVLLVPVYLAWPLGSDQGIFSWIGRVIRNGGLPFRDGWDVKGPVTHYVYALAGVLSGSESWIRLTDLVLAFLGTLATLSLASRFVDRWTALIAALCIFLNYVSFGFWHTAQPDGWVGWLLVGIVLMLTTPEPPRAWTMVAVGALVGVAALTKPVYCGFLALPGASSYLRGGGGRVRSVWSACMSAGVGFALVLGGCAVFFAVNQALPDLLDGYLQVKWEASNVGWQQIGLWRGLRSSLGRTAVLTTGLALAAVGWLRARRDGDWRVHLLGAAAMLSTTAVLVQRKFFDYHFQALFPILGIMAAIGASSWLNAATGRRHRALSSVCIAALVALVAWRVARAEFRWLLFMTGRVSRAEYIGRFRSDVPCFSVLDEERAAGYVRSKTRPEDFVLVWGQPMINVLSGRPTPSRFVDPGPLMGPWRARYQSTFLSDLTLHPPAIVLIREIAFRPTARRGRLPVRFPAFLEFLRTRYERVGSTGPYLVYRERTPSSQPRVTTLGPTRKVSADTSTP